MHINILKLYKCKEKLQIVVLNRMYNTAEAEHTTDSGAKLRRQVRTEAAHSGRDLSGTCGERRDSE
jgi:hypothetical protein